jgi:hypothetical protein
MLKFIHATHASSYALPHSRVTHTNVRNHPEAALGVALLSRNALVGGESYVEETDESRARGKALVEEAPVVILDFVEEADAIRAPASVPTMHIADRGFETPCSWSANVFANDNRILRQQSEPARQQPLSRCQQWRQWVIYYGLRLG